MLSGKKILIVEDDAIIITFISRVLGSLGHSVNTARTGKDALAKVQTSYYDLILLDIGLPDMLGTELLKKIKKANHYMIVIMITGHPDHGSSIESITNDADGYIVKPVSSEDLTAIVERKLRQQEEAKILSDEKVSEWLKDRLFKLSMEAPDKGSEIKKIP
jgi:two-component system, OmpR family, copper resistance phosphate regulon response regulator CusR